MSSVSRITSPSRLTPGEGAGSVPTAIRTCSAVTCRRVPPASIAKVCGSTNDAVPGRMVTSFRRS